MDGTGGTGLAQSQSILEPRGITALKGLRFRIPSYQRGYRWEPLQVKQLLDDIVSSDEDAPYYLQPVVVAPLSADSTNDIDYDLIDGQQRLTTIYLLLQALSAAAIPLSKEEKIKLIEEDRDAEIGAKAALADVIGGKDVAPDFFISYQTRTSSETFLKTIAGLDTDLPADRNLVVESPDHLYMWHAFITIRRWLSENDITAVSKLAQAIKTRVRIIWYELPESITDWKKFTDLNIGKIPLTNSELVKALFLRSDNFSGKNNREAEEYEKQTLVAQWDQIERELADDEFWGFLTREEMRKYPTRIDLLFDLIIGAGLAETKDPYYTFNEFVKWFDENKTTTGKAKWEEIYLQYQRLRDWYDDREIYHLLGYLVAVDYPRNVLERVFRFAHPGRQNRPNRSTARIKRILNRLVRMSLRIPDGDKFKDVKSFRDLKYNISDEPEKRLDTAHHAMIKRYLTLYNIMVTESAGPMLRYSFARHNTVGGGWSLEHIHAQKSQTLNKGWQWTQWICNHRGTLSRLQRTLGKDSEDSKAIASLEARMDAFSESDGRRVFNDIADDFRKVIENLPGVRGLYQDEMANMALLGRDHNSTLNNSTFDVKRQKIINKLSTDFVPIATERVFLKAIEGCDTEHLFFWGDDDRKAYMNDMETKLSKFI